MTTYYGVWSDWSGRDGKEWWYVNDEVFHTPSLWLARAQATVANAVWRRGPRYGTRKHERWVVCAIGEDGLPVSEQRCSRPATWNSQDMMDWMKRGAELDGMLARAEAEQRSRPRLIVCKPCDLDACKAVLDATGLTEEQKQRRSEAAGHKCGICDDVATNWVELCGCKAYLCDQHEEWGSLSRSGRLFCVPKEEEP